VDHFPGLLIINILQCMSASCEQIMMKFFEGVQRGTKSNQFDFGGYPDQYPDPRLSDPGILWIF